MVSKKGNYEIDLHGIKPSKIEEFHKETREALNSSIDEIGIEIQILKEKNKNKRIQEFLTIEVSYSSNQFPLPNL
jgi:hypothetical protein